MNRPLFAIVATAVMFTAWAAAQQNGSSKTEPAQKSAKSTGAPASPDLAEGDDPLFGVPPLPSGDTSLLGGTVQKIDRVRERVTVKPFGNSEKITVQFDERTHIYRDGVEVTERGIQRGDRVYIDSMVDEGRPFARNIRVVTHLTPANARGQIMSYDATNGMMTVRDGLSSLPVSFRITQETTVKGTSAGSTRDLAPGMLVAVRFSPGQSDQGIAREVSVLAVPGTSFTFVGKVRHLDLRTGMLALESQTDKNTYEIQFQPGVVGENVMVGSDVTISALFNGEGYQAKTVSLNAESSRQ